LSKGKYKRKRERKDERAQQNDAQPNLSSCEGEGTGHKGDAANSDKSDRNEKKEVLVRLPETIKRSSFSDWCLVAFTCALAVLGYFQFETMTSQLNVMRNDERAWIQIKPASKDQPQFIEGEKFDYSLTLSNIGKTPARNIRMKAFMNIVPSSQQANLKCVEEGCPGDEVFYGSFFPNDSTTYLMERARGMSTEQTNAWNNGAAYFAVFGMLTYSDVFNVPHWSKFCIWYSKAGNYSAENCTAYNSVDDNR
jgi:hypothetical protein